MSNNRKLVLTAVIAFLVGFGVRSLWANRSSNYSKQGSDSYAGESYDQTNSALSTSDNKSATSLEDSKVIVKDQEAGSSVAIEKVVLKNPGWVAIHEDSSDAPGRILGAQYFLSGENIGIVELLRNTIEGGIYYAMIHADDGDRKFDTKIDLPLLGKSGQPIMVKFMTKAGTMVK